MKNERSKNMQTPRKKIKDLRKEEKRTYTNKYKMGKKDK